MLKIEKNIEKRKIRKKEISTPSFGCAFSHSVTGGRERFYAAFKEWPLYAGTLNK